MDFFTAVDFVVLKPATSSYFERAVLHVRQRKAGKDRYVLLSQHLIRGLKHYIQTEDLNNGSLMDNHKPTDLAVISTGDTVNEAYNGQSRRQSKRREHPFGESLRTLACIRCDIPTPHTYLKMVLTF